MNGDKYLIWYKKNIDSFSFKKFTILLRIQNKDVGNSEQFGFSQDQNIFKMEELFKHVTVTQQN